MTQNIIVKPARSQSIFALKTLGEENQVATNLPYSEKIRKGLFQEIFFSMAKTMLSFSQGAYARQANLEKYQCFVLGTVGFAFENSTFRT